MFRKMCRSSDVTIYFIPASAEISLTTIDHFVALKGQDACDIIMRKIDTRDQSPDGFRSDQSL